MNFVFLLFFAFFLLLATASSAIDPPRTLWCDKDPILGDERAEYMILMDSTNQPYYCLWSEIILPPRMDDPIRNVSGTMKEIVAHGSQIAKETSRTIGFMHGDMMIYMSVRPEAKGVVRVMLGKNLHPPPQLKSCQWIQKFDVPLRKDGSFMPGKVTKKKMREFVEGKFNEKD